MASADFSPPATVPPPSGRTGSDFAAFTGNASTAFARAGAEDFLGCFFLTTFLSTEVPSARIAAVLRPPQCKGGDPDCRDFNQRDSGQDRCNLGQLHLRSLI